MFSPVYKLPIPTTVEEWTTYEKAIYNCVKEDIKNELLFSALGEFITVNFIGDLNPQNLYRIACHNGPIIGPVDNGGSFRFKPTLNNSILGNNIEEVFKTELTELYSKYEVDTGLIAYHLSMRTGVKSGVRIKGTLGVFTNTYFINRGSMVSTNLFLLLIKPNKENSKQLDLIVLNPEEDIPSIKYQ